jgi:hydroxyacylglutathione hydrolase
MRLFPIAPTGQILPDVFVVACRMVNFYLVRGPGGFLAIDSGLSNGQTRKELAPLGIDPAQVVAVFLTHSDYDHAGGLVHFPNARLYLGLDEEPLITGKSLRFHLGRRFNRPLGRPYVLLSDGQTVEEAGLAVQAIATPGHTLGSTSYLVGSKWLFSGDTVRLSAGRAIPFLCFINMDTAVEIRSIRKLSGLEGIDLLATAHHGISRHYKEAMRAWRIGT